MACEVISMNNFRKAILSGAGLRTDPIVQSKQGRGVDPDDLSSIEVSRSETRSQNHREDDRYRLGQETATARFDGKEYEVELVNLSGGGAMISAHFTPRLWQRVDLILGEGGEIECAVRWLRDDRVGLEFAHETLIECDPETRDALLLDVIRRSFSDVTISIAKPEKSVKPATSGEPTPSQHEVDDARRTERRHPLVWSGEVLYNHGSEKVRLRNISEHGALIESSMIYPTGAEIYLDLDKAGQHFATVNWTCGDKAGLKFARPFDLRVLSATKPDLAPSMMTRPGPAGRISSDKDNPWAEGWGRQSLDELRHDLEGYLKR
jgi:hypothetical protein